jgi:transposase
MFERHGIDISRKTMGGWMAQCAELLDPLYQLMKKELLSSKVVGTDDTSVKVLDRKLPFARIGRIWPYVGDAHHPVIVYDYTPTRSRAGPAKFLEGYIRLSAGGRLLRLWRIFQVRTRHNGGWVLRQNCRRRKGWHCAIESRRGLLVKLHQYLLELQSEVLPKSPSGAAVRYALNQWEALTPFLEDGELEIW